MGLAALQRLHTPLDLWFRIAGAFVQSLEDWDIGELENGDPWPLNNETGKQDSAERGVWLNSELFRYEGVTLDDFFELTRDLNASVEGSLSGQGTQPIRDLYVAIHNSIQATEAGGRPAVAELEVRLRAAQLWKASMVACRDDRPFAAAPVATPAEPERKPRDRHLRARIRTAYQDWVLANADSPTNLQIANVVGCSESYVKRVLDDTKPRVEAMMRSRPSKRQSEARE